MNTPNTSSINAAWPPIEASNERYRGFYDLEALTSPEAVDRFTDEFITLEQWPSDDNGMGRLSVRAVASVDMIPEIPGLYVNLEGAIPFQRDGEDYAIVYVGYNNEERQVPPETYGRHSHQIRYALNAQKNTRQHPQAFDLHVSSTPDDRRHLIYQLRELFAAFGSTEEDVRAMLASPHNTIAWAEQNGRVISTAMAESGSVEINGFGTVNLVEITEAITAEDRRSQGLYTAVSGHLGNLILAEVADGSRQADVIYGESNLAMPGVLIAAHRNGRRFSHLDAHQLNIPMGYVVHEQEYPHELEYRVPAAEFGILPQNFAVNDGREERPYNDFALTYLPIPTQTETV